MSDAESTPAPKSAQNVMIKPQKKPFFLKYSVKANLFFWFKNFTREVWFPEIFP